MQLPFVQNSCTSNPPPCTDPISIVRKPQVGESSTSTLGTSRLYNKAQIRILLADTQVDLHPERGRNRRRAGRPVPHDDRLEHPGNTPFSNGAVTMECRRNGVLRIRYGWDKVHGSVRMGTAFR